MNDLSKFGHRRMVRATWNNMDSELGSRPKKIVAIGDGCNFYQQLGTAAKNLGFEILHCTQINEFRSQLFANRTDLSAVLTDTKFLNQILDMKTISHFNRIPLFIASHTTLSEEYLNKIPFQRFTVILKRNGASALQEGLNVIQLIE